MPTDKELMQQALGALEGYARNCKCEGGGAPCDAAKALRARLAQPEPEVKWDASAPLVVHLHPVFQATQPQPSEPDVCCQDFEKCVRSCTPRGQWFAEKKAQRSWQGLTDDEVNNFAAGCHLGKSVQGAIYEAEAKLKEKNGY